MKIFIIIFSVFFTFFGLIIEQEKNNFSIINILFTHLLTFFSQNQIVIIIIFIILLLIGFRINNFNKNHTLRKKTLFTTLQLITSVFLGFYFSLFILFLLAIIELNFFAILYNINPSNIGVKIDNKKIVTELSKKNISPQIITSKKQQKDVLKAIAHASSGKKTFFGNYIIESVPNFLITPVNKSNSSMYLLADTLIITDLKTNDLEVVSPYLGYHLLKRYFPGREIKSYPKISTLKRDEYIAFRLNDAKEKVIKIEQQIQILVNSINSTNSLLNEDRPKFIEEENFLNQLIENEKKSYASCSNEGIYINKIFQRSTSEKICKDRNQYLVKEIENKKKIVSDLKNKIKMNEVKINQLKNSATIFAAQVHIVQNSNENFPHEYGVFVPNNTIRLTIDSQSTDSLLDYLGTLTHEYLHYASFVSEKKKFKDLFFEEGLTEFYARQIIEYDFQKNVNLGYPIFVKIIRQIMNIIPESELSEIYFTKDQVGLENALNRVYGDTFYEDTRLLFATLQYSSSDDEVLEIANSIMNKINGKTLNKTDLESKESVF